MKPRIIIVKRAELGMSQDDLADKAGISRQSIWRIERGETNISIDTLYKIAKALGCEPSELLKKKEELS
jgi:transcriptional regulator with XRE-family HTH domain